MFSSNNKTEPKAARSSAMPSIIADNLTIEGNLFSEGEIQIDGKINGDVQAKTLTIGQNAHITGDINAGTLIIRGAVHGGLRGEEITVTSTATVKGDIIHASLSIEPGAKIDGHLKHSDNPRDLPETVTFLEKSEAASAEK
ncbi:polymer-forming cytoskeletal protein [Sneathiella sp. CAU 1612]|jgi:cytoskeletal protein CcmA (bactofilin family)|uniref:Polymer-forming cytoskeletal protein n=1 Tax=Sneathiella sedimenti TaxID=2816034 RepID=A0ABS3F7M9_9PROT|nr:polymer-forming cytoskeletal protein [Sneathiella sedimenti]MBO0334535.1 polymer-forming cytoskeletal protein [Sneathiella sedimenti]